MIRLILMYRIEWRKLKKLYKKDMIYLFILYLFSVIIGGFKYLHGDKFSKDFLVSLKEGAHENSIGIEWVTIFSNNAWVCLLLVLLGIVGYFILPYFLISVNGLALGIVLADAHRNGLPVWEMFLKGILPHGITELFAMFLSGALGLYWSVYIHRRFIKREEKRKLNEVVCMSIRTFVLIILPLLFVSALIETYISGLLLNHISF